MQVAFSLDVGCGEEKRGDIGIDLRLTPLVDIVTDAHSLPFRPGVFMKCYAFALLEHVSNPILVLEEIYRVLKDEGDLELLVPADSRMISDYVVLILSLHFKHLLQEYNAMRAGEHKWQYSEKFLKNILTGVGFHVVKMQRPAHPFITGRRVGKVLRRLRVLRFPHLMAIARKSPK